MLAILLGLYFLPTIIVISRRKRNAVAVGALNFFLGWTLIGWVVALVWALAHDAHTPSAIESNPATSSPGEQPEQRRRTGFSLKWTAIGVGGVFLGILVVAAIVGGQTTETTPTRASTPTPVPTPTPPPRITAVQLLNEREANATRFDATFRGNWVTVSGEIENIDNSIVYLKGDGFLSSVNLRDLPKEDQIPLNVGQEYSATCKVGDYILGSMSMNSCRPADDGDAEARDI